MLKTDISYEDLASYERVYVKRGAKALLVAIDYLQSTNDMRIVFREELASISEALASIEEKRGGEEV